MFAKELIIHEHIQNWLWVQSHESKAELLPQFEKNQFLKTNNTETYSYIHIRQLIEQNRGCYGNSVVCPST